MSTVIHDSGGAEASLAGAYSELEDLVDRQVDLPCESLLAKYTTLSDNRDWVLELIYLEYILRKERGQEPAPMEFQTRFPELREDIAALFRVDAAIGSSVPVGQGSTYADRSELTPGGLIKTNLKRLGRVGDYELQEVIGRGGMGVVYRAIQTRLSRAVAVKTIDALASLDRTVTERFQLEAGVVARLQHPNIVQIYEIGTHAGIPYFSMELVCGGDLQSVTKDRPLQPAVAARLLDILARAVHFAHSQGVIHRDLKPANVLLAPSTRREAIDLFPDELGLGRNEVRLVEPKIADFGLAKSLANDSQRTQTGAAIGTPSFMAPEQIDKQLGIAGPASDIYSLGAILYYVLVGRPPFHAATVIETLQQARNEDPISPRKLQPRTPRDLETICLTCLHKDPRRRYSTADELANDLHRFINSQPIRARSADPVERTLKWTKRHPTLAALIIAIAIAALAITGLWRRAELSSLAERVERTRAESLVYARDISLAHLEYRSHHVDRCEEILKNCSTESRNWEWQYLKGLCEEHLWETPKYELPILSTALSADGKLLACSYGHWNQLADEPIRVWNITTGELLWELSVPQSEIHSLEFSPDGRSLLSSGYVSQVTSGDRHVGLRIWDLSNGKIRFALDHVSGLVARYLPDGKSFLAGTGAGTIIQFASDGGDTMREFKAHRSYILDIAISSDGMDFVSSSKDRSVRLWDIKSGALVCNLSGLLDDPFEVECSPDGKKLQVAGWSGTLRTYDRKRWDFKLNNVQTRAALPHICYSPDGQYLLTAVYGEGAELRGSKNGDLIYKVHGRGGHIKAATFDRSGRLMATGGSDGSVRIWNLTDTTRSVVNFYTAGPRVSLVVSNPIRPEIALGLDHNIHRADSRQTNIEIHDIENFSTAKQLVGHTDWLTCLAYSRDGNRLISGGIDTTVRIWDAQTGKPIRVFSNHGSAIVGATFLQSVHGAVSADRNGWVKVWDVETGEELRAWSINDSLTSFCLHSNGRHLALGTGSGAIEVWDIATGSKASSCDSNPPVRGLLYSPDGRFLAVTRHGSSSIELFHANEFISKKECRPLLELHGHTDQVNSISFSADGQRLVSSGRDESVRIYDPESGNELLKLHIARGLDNVVQFTAQDALIFSEENRLYRVGLKQKRDRPAEDCFTSSIQVAWHNRQIQIANSKDDFYANVYHRERIAEIQPPTVSLLHFRGLYKAYLGQFESSERDIRAALELKDDRIRRETHGVVCLNLGMIDEYRQDCKQLLAAAESLSGVSELNGPVWTACLSKHSGVDFESWTKKLQESLAGSKLPSTSTVKTSVAAVENTLGLAYVRCKNYPEAIRHTEKSLELGSLIPCIDYIILAIAHAKLNEVGVAQAWLDKALFQSANMERIEAAGLVVVNSVRRSRILEIPILLREATETVELAKRSRPESPLAPIAAMP